MWLYIIFALIHVELVLLLPVDQNPIVPINPVEAPRGILNQNDELLLPRNDKNEEENQQNPDLFGAAARVLRNKQLPSEVIAPNIGLANQVNSLNNKTVIDAPKKPEELSPNGAPNALIPNAPVDPNANPVVRADPNARPEENAQNGNQPIVPVQDPKLGVGDNGPMLDNLPVKEQAGQNPLVAGPVPEQAGQNLPVAGQVPEQAGQNPPVAGQVPEQAGQNLPVAGQVPEQAGQNLPVAGPVPDQVDKPKEVLQPVNPNANVVDQGGVGNVGANVKDDKIPEENEQKPNLEERLDQPLPPDSPKDVAIPDELLHDNQPQQAKGQDDNKLVPQNPYPFESVGNVDANMRNQNDNQGISLNYVFVVICSLLLLLLCAWKPLCHALCAFTGLGIKPLAGGKWYKGRYQHLATEDA